MYLYSCNISNFLYSLSCSIEITQTKIMFQYNKAKCKKECYCSLVSSTFLCFKADCVSFCAIVVPVRKAELSIRRTLFFHAFRGTYFPLRAPVKAYIHFKHTAIGYTTQEREYNENRCLWLAALGIKAFLYGSRRWGNPRRNSIRNETFMFWLALAFRVCTLKLCHCVVSVSSFQTSASTKTG